MRVATLRRIIKNTFTDLGNDFNRHKLIERYAHYHGIKNVEALESFSNWVKVRTKPGTDHSIVLVVLAWFVAECCNVDDDTFEDIEAIFR